VTEDEKKAERRLRLPIISSKRPGSLDLTNADIARMEDEEDRRRVGPFLEPPPDRAEQSATRLWRDPLWRQLGAAVDMLEKAIRACPDDLWAAERRRGPAFWYLAYHTLFFLDLYLAPSPDGFAPPPPFNLDELDPAGVLPERPYTKTELLAYLEHGRRKARETLAALDEAAAAQPTAFPWLPAMPFAELLLVSLRHVQHGAAQLNLLLRQETDAAPAWVKRAVAGLEG
jgi:hypothetical protein